MASGIVFFEYIIISLLKLPVVNVKNGAPADMLLYVLEKV